MDARDKVWSYSLTTWESMMTQSSSAYSYSDPGLSVLSWADPLAGLGIKRRIGMGLPLLRLYTEYLGGSLELMTVPGYGVDVYLAFSRIDARGAASMSGDEDSDNKDA